MGADAFFQEADGDTVEEAFNNATRGARYNYGHAGYTGTIAEKDSWEVITDTPMSSSDAYERANMLLDAGDPRIDDKWGPAGAIPLDTGGWLFFGWASS